LGFRAVASAQAELAREPDSTSKWQTQWEALGPGLQDARRRRCLKPTGWSSSCSPSAASAERP